jgi:hypothetical protein
VEPLINKKKNVKGKKDKNMAKHNGGKSGRFIYTLSQVMSLNRLAEQGWANQVIISMQIVYELVSI